MLCRCAAKLSSATASPDHRKAFRASTLHVSLSRRYLAHKGSQASIKTPSSFPSLSLFHTSGVFASSSVGFRQFLPTPQQTAMSLYLRALCLFLPTLFHLENKLKHAENLLHHLQQLGSQRHFTLLEFPPMGAAMPFSAHPNLKLSPILALKAQCFCKDLSLIWGHGSKKNNPSFGSHKCPPAGGPHGICCTPLW